MCYSAWCGMLVMVTQPHLRHTYSTLKKHAAARSWDHSTGCEHLLSQRHKSTQFKSQTSFTFERKQVEQEQESFVQITLAYRCNSKRRTVEHPAVIVLNRDLYLLRKVRCNMGNQEKYVQTKIAHPVTFECSMKNNV